MDIVLSKTGVKCAVFKIYDVQKYVIHVLKFFCKSRVGVTPRLPNSHMPGRE